MENENAHGQPATNGENLDLTLEQGTNQRIQVQLHDSHIALKETNTKTYLVFGLLAIVGIVTIMLMAAILFTNLTETKYEQAYKVLVLLTPLLGFGLGYFSNKK